MKKVTLITILLLAGLIIAALSVALLIDDNKGWRPELYDQLGQEIDVDYLIECMEIARESHQQFIDMPPELELSNITINEPARFYLNRIGLTLDDQQDWVEIYDQVIEALELLK